MHAAGLTFVSFILHKFAFTTKVKGQKPLYRPLAKTLIWPALKKLKLVKK